VVVEQGGGHLAAPGVVDTDEQDLGRVLHGGSSVSAAGALSRGEYEAGLAAAGFEQVSVAFTHQVGDGLHSAIVKATKPTAAADPATTATTRAGRTTLPMASGSACC
jgi:arsenite methyltransferase